MVSENTEPPEIDPPAPLPRGRTDLSRDEVVRHQRERVIAAVAVVIARQGYTGLTVERVINAARISRTTFYELFDNKQDAVLAAHDAVFERFFALIQGACEQAEEWPNKVDAAIGVVIDFATSRPDQARFLAAEFLAADAVIAERASDSHDQLAELLAEARRHYPRTEAFPPGLEVAMVGGLRSLIARELRSDRAGELRAMHRELVQVTLLPYLGTEAMEAT